MLTAVIAHSIARVASSHSITEFRASCKLVEESDVLP